MRGHRRGADLEVYYEVEVRNPVYVPEWHRAREKYNSPTHLKFSTSWDAEKWVSDQIARNAKRRVEGNEYRVIRVARELWCDSF